MRNLKMNYFIQWVYNVNLIKRTLSNILKFLIMKTNLIIKCIMITIMLTASLSLFSCKEDETIEPINNNNETIDSVNIINQFENIIKFNNQILKTKNDWNNLFYYIIKSRQNGNNWNYIFNNKNNKLQLIVLHEKKYLLLFNNNNNLIVRYYENERFIFQFNYYLSS